MSNEIKIGFTGTREGMNNEQKTKVFELLNTFINKKIIALHGDCVGADTDFHKLCTEFKTKNVIDLTIVVYPPDKNQLRAYNNADIVMKEKSYLQRNDDIIANCDILIGCPFDKNTEILRSGTWSTIRKARKIKKIVYLF